MTTLRMPTKEQALEADIDPSLVGTFAFEFHREDDNLDKPVLLDFEALQGLSPSYPDELADAGNVVILVAGSADVLMQVTSGTDLGEKVADILDANEEDGVDRLTPGEHGFGNVGVLARLPGEDGWRAFLLVTVDTFFDPPAEDDTGWTVSFDVAMDEANLACEGEDVPDRRVLHGLVAAANIALGAHVEALSTFVRDHGDVGVSVNLVGELDSATFKELFDSHAESLSDTIEGTFGGEGVPSPKMTVSDDYVGDVVGRDVGDREFLEIADAMRDKRSATTH